MSVKLESPSPAPSSSSHASADSNDQASRTLRVSASATALVMAVFSTFVVTVGDSVRTFHAGVAGEAWGLSGMSLGLATALLTAGALADDIGHRRVLRWSAGLLAGASALGALAPSMETLVAARVLQGVAGGGVLAAGLGAIGRAFPAGSARTRATGVWGAAVGGGVTIGPLAAALLAAAIGWRSGFWIETAGAAAVMMAAAALTESRTSAGRSLDLPGIVALAAGMALLTAALVNTRHGWSSPITLALFSGAALVLAVFGVREMRARHPMLDPQLLAQPQFLASLSGALFTGLAVIGLMSYAPALMQQSLRISVLSSAAVLAAWSATSMIVALTAGSLGAGLSSQTRLLIGLAMAAIGEAALTGIVAGSTWMRFVPGLVIAGAGTSIVNGALGRIAVESVPRSHVGMRSGANNTARYLGGAAGAALIVSIASTGGSHALIDGWNIAARVSAGLCVLGVATVANCRSWRGHAAHREALRMEPPTPAQRCTPESTGAD
jgi:MFS family permease